MIVCPKCAARFAEPAELSRCPRCGAEIEPDPTATLADDPSTGRAEESEADATVFMDGPLVPEEPAFDEPSDDARASQQETIDSAVFEEPEVRGASSERSVADVPDEPDDESEAIDATFVMDPDATPSDPGPGPTIELDSQPSADESSPFDTRPSDVPMGSGDQSADDSDASPADSEVDATYISDEWAEHNLPLSPPTQAFDSGDDVDFVVDTRFTPGSADLGAPDAHRTDAGDISHDSAAATRASDDASPGEMGTLDDNWGRADGDRPEMTIKSRADSSDFGGSASLSRLESIPRRSLRSNERTDIQHPEYELVSVLGEGGMGIVWDARQTSVDRSVAVKMIKGPMATRSSHREKFLAEAIVTGDLDHPNIVPIYDVGTDDRGTLFYSMKQVHGTPWQKVIKEKSQHENLEILMRVADAVAFAHDRGIVHRDLKPENVMLGAYGEVLVMDWGLAMPMPQFRKRRTLAQPSMGGTPAYMAPEMATGPLERITASSDIYLLGAILYEIITGRPPHPGRKVKECLLGAMRNVIAPTEKTGELVDIAMRAMATLPSDRYATVKDFQDALRDYLSHSESIVLSVRADQDLAEAIAADDYTIFSKAVFGFEEAIDLWDGNREARDGLVRARQAYAKSALNKGDYDLGLSLLDRKNPSHRALVARLEAAQNERQARQQRLKVAKRAMAAMAVCLFVIVTGAFFWIRGERNIAQRERDNADSAKREAVVRRLEAETSKQEAEEQRDEARRQERIAAAERDRAEDARKIAQKERDEADRQRQLAEDARAAEEYEAYIARIGLAAAKIDENAFDVAVELLEECKPELRNWEWGRLMHLCRQASRTFTSDAPVDAVDLSPDGTRIVTGSWDHDARIWDAATGEVLQTLPHQGLYVHSVDWSGDGRYVATGGSDPQMPVQIWDADSGERIAGMAGHTDPVIGVRFSDDGRWLLSCSYDETARLWDLTEIASPREVCVLEGHNWWVWSGAFAPGFNPEAAGKDALLATAGQDGKVILWNIVSAEGTVTASQRGVFYGHRGPVYSVAFDPDGSAVASAGYDRRLLLWNPDDLKPFDFEAILEGEDVSTEFREFSGHKGAVQAVRFSRDGSMLVSGSRDNSVKVWDVATGTAVKTFRGHYSGVSDVAFDHDGRRVVSAGRDHQTIVWSVDNYEEFRTLYGRTLDGHEDVVLSASFSADGERIVTASRDRTARTWETSTGELLKVYEEGHEYLASQAELLPDGRVLVTSAADDTVRFWDVTTGAELWRLSGTGRSAALAISSDGQWLVTGSDTNEVLVWDVRAALDQNETEPVARLAGHNANVTAVAFHPDSNLCLTGDAKGRCILSDVTTGKTLWNVRHHTRRINLIRFVPTNGDASARSTVLCASQDHTTSRLDVATGEELRDLTLPHPTPVTGLTVSNDGRFILTACDLDTDESHLASRITLWNAASGKSIATLDLVDQAVNTLRFSQTGPTVAVATCSDNTVRYLHIRGGAELVLDDPFLNFSRMGGIVWSAAMAENDEQVLTVGGREANLWDARTGEMRMSFSPHGAVASAQFSPDGRFIVTGSWDNSAKIWDAQTGRGYRKLEGGHTGYVNSAVFSPDGRYVLTASDDRTVRLWDVESATVVRSFNGHTDRVHRATFSPDGRFILTASSDRTARVWDVATGEQLGEPFVGHRWAVLDARFSPDGKRVVTGSEDNQAWIWNVEDRSEIARLEGHIAAVTTVAFSQDGSRVFTSSRDNTAKIWDATDGNEGTEILTLTGHAREVTSVTVSPDNRYVLTSGRDGKAIVWLTSDWKAEPGDAERPAFEALVPAASPGREAVGTRFPVR